MSSGNWRTPPRETTSDFVSQSLESCELLDPQGNSAKPRGANTLTFKPLDHQPHCTAKMRCQMCGMVAAHVWPEKLPIRRLECCGCHRVGVLTAV